MIPSRWSSAIAILRRRLQAEQDDRRALAELAARATPLRDAPVPPVDRTSLPLVGVVRVVPPPPPGERAAGRTGGAP